ncbi:hypothetical protein [Saccharopolyspora griseoalba]|uniref:Uncharacterized protein n=1 Tax=Saccharopolyspora griseoalba TaxID=1431848 RepID=A0ABW2LSU2_9PSEU
MPHRRLGPTALDRRQLFRIAGAAGAAAATGIGVPVAAGAAGAPPGPFDLHFDTAHQHRPFDLLSPGFVLHESGPARLREVLRTEREPIAPYATLVLEVADAGSGVRAGLATGTDSVMAVHDPATGEVSVQVTRNGSTTVVGTATAELGTSHTFAFVLNENFVTALADTGDGWRPLLRERVNEVVDLRDPAVLVEHTFGYGPREDGAALEIASARAGYYGAVGVRDPHLVTHADGTPYIRAGKAYLTMTNAGLGFFQTAHWGVWELDLADPTVLRQVAHLFFQRDGAVLGDHAGHLVFDDLAGEFIVTASGWGDFAGDGLRCHIARTREDVLSGVHVLESRPMALPTEASGAWDPALARIDGTWHVAFVESPSQDPFQFHPALATGASLDELAPVAADTSLDQTEGTILQKIGGTWYLLASDGDARNYRVYDLGMEFLGTLDAPYGTNIPHPMIIPVPEQGETRYLMVTFDGAQYAEPVLGYGTHGDFYVMTAPETRPGYEFPPR